LVGGLASVAGLVYAVYWRDAPSVTYAVAANRARIVVAGQASALRVFYGDLPISGDVTAAQIAVWNDGRRAVEGGDVLNPLRLVSEPRVRILEARWRSATRDVCALDLDRTRAAEGELTLRFRILEPQDGGVLQVIYAGPPDTALRLEGVLRGQPTLRLLTARPTGQTGLAGSRGVLIVFGLLLLSTSVGVAVSSLREIANAPPRHRWVAFVAYTMVVLFFTVGGVRLILGALHQAETPFPF
jgi:hypothetical protein